MIVEKSAQMMTKGNHGGKGHDTIVLGGVSAAIYLIF